MFNCHQLTHGSQSATVCYQFRYLSDSDRFPSRIQLIIVVSFCSGFLQEAQEPNSLNVIFTLSFSTSISNQGSFPSFSPPYFLFITSFNYLEAIVSSKNLKKFLKGYFYLEYYVSLLQHCFSVYMPLPGFFSFPFYSSLYHNLFKPGICPQNSVNRFLLDPCHHLDSLVSSSQMITHISILKLCDSIWCISQSRDLRISEGNFVQMRCEPRRPGLSGLNVCVHVPLPSNSYAESLTLLHLEIRPLWK